jgi:hypothetical protein
MSGTRDLWEELQRDGRFKIEDRVGIWAIECKICGQCWALMKFGGEHHPGNLLTLMNHVCIDIHKMENRRCRLSD